MDQIFDKLPGLEVPVSQISQSLARMWQDTAAEGKAAPAADEVKATQVNFILHIGFGSNPEDALKQFANTVDFSSRYPSRVVVLCPRHPDTVGHAEMRAKIYGECFLGKSKGDSRCCEFVILSYSMAARPFLESQVSICLLADLPVYYWLHRFRSCQRIADYKYLLRHCQRLLVDMATAPEDALDFPWPNPAGLRDLAYARALPIRQSIGLFLSRYDSHALSHGLKRVTISYEEVHLAEGRALLRWAKERLADCGAVMKDVEWTEEVLPYKAGVCFGLSFFYRGEKQFAWRGNCDSGVAHFCANFGNGYTEMPAHIALLNPAQALSEAMFF